MIVLDTDVLIEIYDKKSRKGERILKKIAESGESAAITAVNLHEIAASRATAVTTNAGFVGILRFGIFPIRFTSPRLVGGRLIKGFLKPLAAAGAGYFLSLSQ